MLNTYHSAVGQFRRRRVLGAEEKSSLDQRYNIISGAVIYGEPYSGYKEGRRAVIQSFAHIDSTTNVRNVILQYFYNNILIRHEVQITTSFPTKIIKMHIYNKMVPNNPSN